MKKPALTNLKFIALIAAFSLILINPSWSLFAITGFLIGIVFYFLLAKGFLTFVRLIFVVVFMGSIISLIWLSSRGRFVRYQKLGPYIERIQYSGHIIYVPENKVWKIQDEILIDKSFLEEIQDSLFSQGWETAGVINEKTVLTLQREQQASVRWFPFHTTNLISMPKLKYSDFILLPNDDSYVVLDAPKHMVAITYPYYFLRVDLLQENKEQFTIPLSQRTILLSLGSTDRFTIRIQVLNPLFHHRIIRAIVQAVVWPPLKWILLALCAVFAEQIKRDILAPTVKKIFSFLKMLFQRNKENRKLIKRPLIGTNPSVFENATGGRFSQKARINILKKFRSKAFQKKIWALLNSKFVLLVLGFIFTTLVGSYLNNQYQKATWEREKNFEILTFKLNQEVEFIEKFSELAERRFFSLQRLKWVMQSEDREAFDRVWEEYYQAVIDWNQKLNINYDQVRRFFGVNIADEFYNVNESDNSGGLHGRFREAHDQALEVKECFESHCLQFDEKLLVMEKNLESLNRRLDQFIVLLNEHLEYTEDYMAEYPYKVNTLKKKLRCFWRVISFSGYRRQRLPRSLQDCD